MPDADAKLENPYLQPVIEKKSSLKWFVYFSLIELYISKGIIGIIFRITFYVGFFIGLDKKMSFCMHESKYFTTVLLM